MRVVMAGAGLSGARIGRALAEAGHQFTVMDPRPHVAGNCHTERRADGRPHPPLWPHIFHTPTMPRCGLRQQLHTRLLPYKNR